MAVDFSDPACAAALTEVKNPKSSTNWVLFGYDKQTPKIKVVGKGSGGMAEMQEEMSDGAVRYAFMRYTIGNVNKFVYISWCGEGVTGMLKGRFNQHVKDMERHLNGFHVQVNARVEKDLDDAAIKSRLTKAQGANYDAGQRDQGQKKGGVASVSEGVQKVTAPKAKEIKKTDTGNVGLDKRNEFWKKQENEDAKNAQGYVPQREDATYKATQQRQQFWNQHEKDEEARKAAAAPQARPVGTAAGARNLKSQFEAKAASTTAPPPPKAVPKRGNPVKPIAPPPEEEAPAAEEYQQEAPAEEYQQEAPAEEYQQEAPAEEYQQEAPAEEQPPAEEYQQEAPAEEAPAEEQPAEEAPAEAAAGGQVATALYDYAGEAEGDLAFSAGDQINILDTSDPSGWWQGELNGVTGVFPSNFVEIRP